MTKKIVLLTLVSVFLLSAMVLTSSAQERIVGVNVDDWFKFGDITVSWSSNDPNATFPVWLEEMNETEWMLMSVEGIFDTNITFQTVDHYKNGTERIQDGYIDIDTGDSSEETNETASMELMAISVYLDVNDTVYTSGDYSTWKINETVVRTYPDGVRETNHVNMTWEYSFTINETEYYVYNSMSYYWDRESGIIVEYYYGGINQIGEYLTTWSTLVRTTESNVWVIPEFPTWASMLLVFVTHTIAIAIYKRIARIIDYAVA